MLLIAVIVMGLAGGGTALNQSRHPALADTLNVTEFPDNSPFGFLSAITKGPDDRMYYSSQDANVKTMASDGTITTYPTPAQSGTQIGCSTYDVTSGPDAALWVTEPGCNKVARMDTSGNFTEFDVKVSPLPGNPKRIVTGSDGNLWFTYAQFFCGSTGVLCSGSAVGRLTTTGTLTVFTLTGNSGPDGITAGTDGNIWAAEPGLNSLARITPAGVVTEFPGTNGARLVVASAEDVLWFSGGFNNTYGSMTLAGQVALFTLPDPSEQIQGMTEGPDGNIWFTATRFDSASTTNVGLIGYIDVNGAEHEFGLPTPPAGSSRYPTAITRGVSGELWYTDASLRVVGFTNLSSAGHRPLIFVPGIAGSELYGVKGGSFHVRDSKGKIITVSYNAGDVIWLNGLQLLTSGEYYNLLQFNNQGLPVVPDIQPDGQLITIAGSGYAGVQAALEGHGYKLGRDLFIYTYDWRFGAQTFAAGLDQLVGQVMAQTHSDGVDIVAHSMGNMVVRSWLLTGANTSSLKHYVSLAAPDLGTPKGTFAALGGACVPDVPCLISKAVVKSIFETIPGGLDQSVSKSYYTVYRGQDKSHPLPYVDYRNNRAGNFTSYAGLRQTLISSGVTQAALSSAEAFHASDLTWPAAIPAGAKVSLMSGTGHCTTGQITAHDSQWPPIFGPHTTKYDYGEINGDGTVVEESSSLNNGKIGNLPVYYRVATHAEMGQNANILSDAIRLLQDHGISRGSRQAPFLNGLLCRKVAVHSPMEMLLTDANGLRTGGLDANTNLQEVPSAQFERFADMKMVTIETASQFRVDVKGTGTGDSTLDIRSIGLNGVADAVIFRHLTTTPATTGSFTYDSGTGLASNLTLDVNGDGKNIQTIAPILLSGSAVDDTTPPTITITSPAAGQALVGAAPISWTASDAGSGVNLSMAVIDAKATSDQTGENQGENSDGRHRIVLNQPRTVTLSPGTHTLDVYAEDKAGNSATAHRDFTVDVFKWQHAEGGEDENARGAGSTIHVQFEVTKPDGGFVADPTVVLDLLNGQGSVVATGSVEIQDHNYRGTIQTAGLAPGSYQVRARFNSSLLVGTETQPAILR